VEDEKGFKQLSAWQHADTLACGVFRLTEKLSDRHRWLGLQLVRAAVSVPANIAEGYGRGYVREYVRFVDIARGSLAEVEYYLHFMAKEGLVPSAETDKLESIRKETGRTLKGLQDGLKRRLGANSTQSGNTNRVREEMAVYEVEV
jgi:four helix bundle protein